MIGLLRYILSQKRKDSLFTLRKKNLQFSFNKRGLSLFIVKIKNTFVELRMSGVQLYENSKLKIKKKMMTYIFIFFLGGGLRIVHLYVQFLSSTKNSCNLHVYVYILI